MAKNPQKKSNLSISKKKEKVQEYKKYLSYRVETDIGGFGNKVFSIVNIDSGIKYGYINEMRHIALKAPLHINDLKKLITFLESNNPYQQDLNESHVKITRA